MSENVNVAKLPLPFRCNIRGVSFHAENASLVGVGQWLRVDHDADNPHDANAMAVGTLDGRPLGHLPAALAERLLRSHGEGPFPALVEAANPFNGTTAITIKVVAPRGKAPERVETGTDNFRGKVLVDAQAGSEAEVEADNPWEIHPFSVKPPVDSNQETEEPAASAEVRSASDEEGAPESEAEEVVYEVKTKSGRRLGILKAERGEDLDVDDDGVVTTYPRFMVVLSPVVKTS